jgi:hypothetical protein
MGISQMHLNLSGEKIDSLATVTITIPQWNSSIYFFSLWLHELILYILPPNPF